MFQQSCTSFLGKQRFNHHTHSYWESNGSTVMHIFIGKVMIQRSYASLMGKIEQSYTSLMGKIEQSYTSLLGK